MISAINPNNQKTNFTSLTICKNLKPYITGVKEATKEFPFISIGPAFTNKISFFSFIIPNSHPQARAAEEAILKIFPDGDCVTLSQLNQFQSDKVMIKLTETFSDLDFSYSSAKLAE